MRLAALTVVSALATCPGPALAQLYTQHEIAADRARLAGRITEMHGLLTQPQYLPPGAQLLSQVAIQTPDYAPDGDPMGFYAAGGEVVMPVAGLKFIEDLTMAYAWRYRQQRTLEPLDEYLAMLRWKPESEWPEGTYLDPLDVFGVPPGAWERDASLAELGTSLRNEAWAFVLAHELAHVLYAHPGNSAPPATSQANEAQADAFAMALMESTDTLPLGAFLYFQATVAFYTSRADFPSDSAYARWQREQATHPVNAQRLMAIAQQLQLWARREADEDRQAVLFDIGDKMEQFAAGLGDPAMQQLVVRRAVYGDPLDLRER
jgi:hypothetical protein